MEQRRKITVEIFADLLERAQKASGVGVTQTVRQGLEIIAASQAYKQLRQMRGTVKFSQTWQELKDQR